MTVNEKIAKWCGFIYVDNPACECHPKNRIRYWLCPNKDYYGLEFPDFQNDFNACLQWVVPELNKRGYMIEIVIYLDLSYLICIHDPEFNNLYEGDGQSLPAAFTDALEKLIDSEEKI